MPRTVPGVWSDGREYEALIPAKIAGRPAVGGFEAAEAALVELDAAVTATSRRRQLVDSLLYAESLPSAQVMRLALGLRPHLGKAPHQAMTAFRRAVGAAVAREELDVAALEQKPDCSTMITGPSQFTAQAILYTLRHNNHIVDRTSENSPNQGTNDKIYATTDIGRGSDGYMTIWQPFTNPEAGGPVTVLLEYQGQPLHQHPNWQDIFRTAVILHELSHATGAIGDDSGWSVGRKADSFNAIIDKCL